MFDFKGAIFDLDGTIIDSMNVWEKIDIEFLSKRNIDMPNDYMEKINIMSFEEAAKYTIERFNLKEKKENLIKEWNEMAIYEYSNNIRLKPNVKEYLEKLKASLKEINTAMNNAGLEASSTSFLKFVGILKQGANYSKEIAISLQKASSVIGKIDDFNNNVNAAKNKAKLTKNEKDLTIGELQNKRNLKSTREEQLKTLKSTYKEYSKYDI